MRARCPAQPRTFDLITVLTPYGLYKFLLYTITNYQFFCYFLPPSSKYLPKRPVVNYPTAFPVFDLTAKRYDVSYYTYLYFSSYDNIEVEAYEMEV